MQSEGEAEKKALEEATKVFLNNYTVLLLGIIMISSVNKTKTTFHICISTQNNQIF